MAGNGNKDTQKSPIKIRFKAIKNGYQSIYLDCYHNGHRSYEYLKLYLVPETDDKAVRQNAAAMRKAEATLKDRLRELKKLPPSNKRFVQESVPQTGLTLSEWLARFKEIQRSRGVKCLRAIDQLCSIFIGMGNSDVKLKAVDKDFCLSFMEYLKTGYKTADGRLLKSKTIFNRQCTLITALNVAVREGLIPSNPMDKLSRHERAKTNRGKREYLTIDEVKALIATPCRREDIKNAYLFACNCGLRLGDVRKLKWGDITKDGDKWMLSVVMNKSEKPVHIPLGVQARRWLPKRKGADTDSLVFGGLPRDTHINAHLKIWTAKAGITKAVTYHTSRHTFATMLLALGADLYTVSKLLGHSKIKNTQVYAEIISRRKDEAVNLADKIFD
ncbi:site-specific integrase [Parabacteroides distasonis]|uniref:site-specific integrase n=1 Tax=Parabacteroides distasonis TaxID=823 RepID=UPI00189C84CA|nr:site-specific integrase [Parabacteroides distasonis]MDB9154141.1 tyrosine-type recombinase/integrase [Parabacteroides distasonis]MDB9158670.1 tyrosine-type recombinase/integrase [Parabacteroides distasonis]MDB9167446.1 tyrosine-type recombinase/integrase [Parabacteroides distasonis]MDB9171956.1 tyrosine-type recombinase/integrase [Parabacteroides distasonis]MDB9197430.1 tyrosine-type recombinase/integrase [Parabacteroides distasonis]